MVRFPPLEEGSSGRQFSGASFSWSRATKKNTQKRLLEISIKSLNRENQEIKLLSLPGLTSWPVTDTDWDSDGKNDPKVSVWDWRLWRRQQKNEIKTVNETDFSAASRSHFMCAVLAARSSSGRLDLIRTWGHPCCLWWVSGMASAARHGNCYNYYYF